MKAVPALIHALEDEHYQVRKLAAMTLSKAGPAAKPAVPELARMLQDKEFDVTWAAALALKALGPIAAEAVEPVAEMMLWEDQRQDTARQILPRIGAPAVPSLIGLLQNDRFAVRHAGAGALVRIGTPSVDGLIAALKNSNAAGRKTAAEVLGEILPIRKDVAGALTQAMKDKDADVRQSASDALRRIRARQGGSKPE